MFLLYLFCALNFIVLLPALLYVNRFNLHMFQLNGYKNNEWIVWLKHNTKSEVVALLALVSIVQCIFFNSIACYILSTVLYCFILAYYLLQKKKRKKKSLVYTNRVKRILFSEFLVLIIASTLILLNSHFTLFGISLVIALFGMATALNPIYLLVVNVINHPMERGINHYYINDAKKKLAAYPNIKIIGVTGSYGKTSVKYYLETLLSMNYNVLITPASYNTTMGVVRTIRESLNGMHEIFICEMGARYVGDVKEICNLVHPQYGIITSIGPQHLETFRTMDSIIKTKFELADSLPPNGMIFLNFDNQYIREKIYAYQNVLTYSVGNNASYRADNVRLSSHGTEFTVFTPDEESEVFQMHLIGQHNVINVLGAIAIAHHLGVQLKTLKVAVRRLKPVEHRLQMKQFGNNIIIDDAYNSNPVGASAALDTLNMFDGIKIIITPGMVELGEEEQRYNFEFGMHAADVCNYILLVGAKHTEPIRDGVIEKGFEIEKCVTFETVNEALTYAYSILSTKKKYILLENDLPDQY